LPVGHLDDIPVRSSGRLDSSDRLDTHRARGNRLFGLHGGYGVICLELLRGAEVARLRGFTSASLIIVLVSGLWAATSAAQHSPIVGLAERTTIGAFMLWLLGFAVTLFRRAYRTAPSGAHARSALASPPQIMTMPTLPFDLGQYLELPQTNRLLAGHNAWGAPAGVLLPR
jgi:hypothetical protein